MSCHEKKEIEKLKVDLLLPLYENSQIGDKNILLTEYIQKISNWVKSD